MTTSELVLQTLSGHHEQSVGQLYKKLAGQPGINNSKSVSNALMRLKKDGRVTNTFDSDRAIWLWRVVKEGEVVPQSECPPDHSEHDLEMVSDTAKVEATLQQNLTVDADMVATLDALDTERERQERQAVAETPESFTDTWSTTLTTHFKSAHKPHLAISDIMDAYHQEVAEDTDQNFYSFCLGVAYAEKHHGISQ